MNRKYYVLFVDECSGDVNARTTSIMVTRILAEGDTISSQTMIDSIRIAGKEDTLKFDYLVIDDNFYLEDSDIDTVWCGLSFFNAEFQGFASFEEVQFQRDAYFWGAYFQGDAIFNIVEIQGNATSVK